MIGKILWEGSHHFKKSSHLYHYQQWLSRNRGLEFNNYHELWEWSINNIEDFWASLFLRERSVDYISWVSSLF